MTPARSLGWRAVEAAVVAGFGYAVGFDLPLALAVGVLALAVNATELLGERHGYPVALRHAALALALVAFASLAASRGAGWFAAAAAPAAAWFLLDSVALVRRDDDRPDHQDTGSRGFEDVHVAGELLRAVRAEPRTAERLAVDLDISHARAERALAALDAAGTLERDDAGRYRLGAEAATPVGTDSVPARVEARLLAPFRAF